jgi:hypothetical protein
MAKPNKMAAEAEAAAAVTKVAIDKDTYLMEDSAWEAQDSPEFGGQSAILELEVGEIAGPLVYVGSQEMALESGPVKVHMAQTPNKDVIRCPIAAAFLRSFDQAGIQKGDTFAIKRYDDSTKKAGKGKGQSMHIFAVKVLKKVVQQPTA